MFVALLFISCSLALDFNSWLVKHGKKYTSAELLKRKAIFNRNARYVAEYNKHHKFHLSVNGPFADMTNEEYNHLLKEYTIEDDQIQIEESKRSIKSVPESIDWREKGVVPAVRDQASCGSCYAFGAVGALECRFLIGGSERFTADNLDLSEQQIVSCSGNSGCGGGSTARVFTYVQLYGIMQEVDFPYTATDGNCSYDKSQAVVTCSGHSQLPVGSEAALTEAVAEGPVVVSIDASHDSFHLYSDGVYDEPACSTTYHNHAVVVVGYGTLGEDDYYIVRNSWGDSWGQEGYILMSRNKNNQCSITSNAIVVKNPTEL
ncbi:Cysteine proteinase 3 [Entamoeba marina]